jgi:hypothetical protein
MTIDICFFVVSVVLTQLVLGIFNLRSKDEGQQILRDYNKAPELFEINAVLSCSKSCNSGMQNLILHTRFYWYRTGMN